MSKKIFEYWLNKIKASEISEKNKQLLNKLSQDMLDMDLSYGRVRFFLAKFWVIIKIVNKDLDQLNEEDIKNLMRTLKKSNYSSWTLYGYKVIIKKFYQWLAGYEWTSKKYPKKVEWIKLTRKRNEQRLPEEILVKEEVMRLVENADNIRNKTLIISLYEAGARINELLNIKIKDIEFDDYGLTVIVSGKTGSRKLRLVTAVPYINMLLRENSKDRENYLFTSRNGNRLSEWSVRKILEDVAKKCNVVKPVNPHAFRHARATHLSRKLTEAEMKIFFGWEQSSKMASIYVHLSGRDLDDSMLKKVYGLVPEEKEEKETQNLCLVCKEKNAIEAHYCKACGSVLHVTKETLEEMIDKILTEKNSK